MTTTSQPRPSAGNWWVFAIPVVIVLLDQALKALMTDWLGPGSPVHRHDVIGTFAGFQYLENRGAAFGILPDQTGLLTATAIAIAAFGLVVMWREAPMHPGSALAIGMIVGGAIGNIIDRLRLGYVVDFIAVGAWPRFNVADSMVTIGVVWLLWTSLRSEQAQLTQKTEEDADE